MNPNAPVIVAVGTSDCEAALRYAARQAQVSNAPVSLVHVLQVSAGDAAISGTYSRFAEAADMILANALLRFRALTDDRVPVSSRRFDQGPPVTTLVEAAAEGSQIVMTHRHLSRAHRLVTGSTVSGVAARAPVPVVAVPDGWQPGEEARRVTAAVQDVDEAAGLLQLACETARVHALPLTLLHAWWLHSGYETITVDEHDRQQRAEEFVRDLKPVLDGLEAEWPDVDVTVEVVHGPPIEAVLDAAESSDLIVIGRRHHLLPVGTHLGPVARAALDRSACPVLIATEVKTVRG